MARYPIKQRFWRDAGLLWLEVRNVQDGTDAAFAMRRILTKPFLFRPSG